MRISEKLADLFEKQACYVPPNALSRQVPLCSLCTMRVGGKAAYVVCPPDLESFCRLLCAVREAQIPYLILGAGSNVIAGDSDFEGVVFSTKKLQKIAIEGTKIKAECGFLLNRLILLAAKRDLCCMERLYGIPGTVGGAVKMNAGAHGTNIADWLVCATLFSPVNGGRRVFTKEELAFSYRDSLLQHCRDLVVLDATFQALPKERRFIKQSIEQIVRLRLHAQPIGLPSAGSVFRRPPEGEAVWRLIERCGLRGHTVGGAQISPKHAGFIVNCGNASAKDVCSLVGLSYTQVLSTCGVSLVPEVEFFHLSEEEKCHLPIL